MEEIRFDEVSTENAEKTFVEIILKKSLTDRKESYQTFFLNGVWGSGKTTFLNNAERNANRTRFVNLKLWELQDERSVTAIAFSLLHPFQYKSMRVLILFMAVISVLMTPAINLGLSTNIPNYLITIGTIMALLVTVYQLIKVKSDSLYIRLLPRCLNNKVLIIDDFDRISVERQNEAYKLFNILNGKLPIVFIGDYHKISKGDEESGKYLQKIIDRRLELPSVLNSRNIWTNYLDKLSSAFGIKEDVLNPEIILIIKNEDRTLRELKQFSDLLNYELFERGKRDLVNIQQLITIVYIFLFYPKYYLELKDFGELLLDSETVNLRDRESSYEGRNRSKTIKERFYEFLIDNTQNTYPRQFINNREIYYVDEYVKNLSLKEARDIFSDENKLREVITSNNNDDFYAYLVMEYSKFQQPMIEKFIDGINKDRKVFENNRTLIEKLVIEEVKEGNRNQITNFVVSELGKKIYLESKSEIEKTGKYKKSIQGKNQERDTTEDEIKKLINEHEYRRWKVYTQKFSLSEKIKFHLDYRFGGQFIIPLLTELSQKMLQNKDELDLENHKVYIYYLVTRNFENYRDNENHIKQLVDELSDSEFLDFWELMGLIERETIWTKHLDFKIGIWTDNSDIYELNKERIESIGKKRGIKFKINSH